MESVATPSNTVGVLRCPACGRANDAQATRCQHCQFDFAARDATGEDVTPYATGFDAGKFRWAAMCRWIYGASAARIAHVAKMRGSPASRSFAAKNLLLLAFAVALVAATQYGWHVARRPLEGAAASGRPAGKGWLAVSSGRLTSPDAIAFSVDIWWNPAQAIIAGSAGLVLSLIAAWMLLLVLRITIEMSHRPRYRREGRMSAAIRYSTAWIAVALPAAIVLALWPLFLIGAARRWTWAPSEAALMVTAGGLAGVAAMLWWFWSIRLASTAPADTRDRVVFAFLLIIPLILLGGAIGWWIGLARLLHLVFEGLNLNF